MTAISSFIPPLPLKQPMDTSGNPSKKRKAGEALEEPSSTDAEPAFKKPRNPKMVFQDFPAVQKWAVSLPKRTENVVYMGPADPKQNFDNLLLREGVGRITEVTEFAKKKLIPWRAVGNFASSQGHQVLGSFIVESTNELLEQVKRCDVDYRSFRDKFKDGLTTVKDQCLVLFRSASLVHNKPLGADTQLKVEAFVKSLMKQVAVLDTMIKNPENGLLIEFERLTQQTLRAGHCMDDNQVAMKQLEDPTAEHITLHNMFTNETMFIKKHEDKAINKACIDKVSAFYNDYDTLLKSYEVYLRKFYKSVLQVSEIYKEGIALFKLTAVQE